MSSLFAYSARWRLAHNIARGEPGMELAEAALLVAAEDDAIASHSTVAFPIEPYLARIQQLADAFDLQRLEPRRRAAAAAPSAAAAAAESNTPAAVLQQLEDFLFQEQRISVPPFGRSNLPPNTLLDHPGVWEDARWGYLNELLIRKKGHSAAVAILVAEIMRRLLSRGSLDFAVAMDVRGFSGLPKAIVLPGITRGMLLDPTQRPQPPAAPAAPPGTQAGPAAPAGERAASDAEAQAQPPAAGPGDLDAGAAGRQQGGASSSGSSRGGLGPVAGASGGSGLFALNTCTSDTLAELLRHLKRSYWPLPWDTNVDAYAQGGNGSHGGFKAAAKAGSGDEMSAQLRAVSTVANWRLERGVWTSPGAGDIRRCRAACERLVLLGGEHQDVERRDLAVVLLHCGELAAARAELGAYMDSQHFRLSADGIDKVLCKKMMQLLQQVKSLDAPRPLTLEGVLAGPSPDEVKFSDRKMPLTW